MKKERRLRGREEKEVRKEEDRGERENGKDEINHTQVRKIGRGGKEGRGSHRKAGCHGRNILTGDGQSSE